MKLLNVVRRFAPGLSIAAIDKPLENTFIASQ
jgi:hypothetical protein